MMQLAGAEQIDGDGDDRPLTAYPKLSCQSCRLRKIRCDHEHPCGPCARRQDKCIFPTGVKARERRQKALISTSYEDKLDNITKKLEELCDIFNNNRSSYASSQSQVEAPSSTATALTRPEKLAVPEQSEEPPSSDGEGEPTLAAQVAFAANYAHRAFSISIISKEMKHSLEVLDQCLEDDRRKPNSRGATEKLLGATLDLADIKMPPLELAISCIQKLRKSAMFFWTWDIDNVGQLLEYTTTVYMGKASIAELVIVNSFLSRLLAVCIRDEDTPSARAEQMMHSRQYQKNLDILLSRLPLNLESNFDNILALFQAAIYSLDRCKTLTAWKYIVASVQMCQTIGYHREVALVPETNQQKRRRKRLVWMIIIVDKGLSLRTGRPSAIRDSDLTLERVTDAIEDDVSAIGPASIFPKWIDFALLQGRIFDDLYSPAALLQPEVIRASRAQALAADLRRVFEVVTPVESQFSEAREQALGTDLHELFNSADRINFLATLTLIYQAIPTNSQSGSAFGEECISTALEALDEHQRVLSTLKKSGPSVLEMYLQWAFLFSPFVPFIVVFCRVFETGDPIYLDKLSAVVETLSLLFESAPDSSAQHFKSFRPMYEVAHSYIQANGHPHQVSHPDLKGFFQNVTSSADTTMAHEAWTLPGDWGESNSQETLGMDDLSAFQTYAMLQLGDSGTELERWLDRNHRGP